MLDYKPLSKVIRHTLTPIFTLSLLFSSAAGAQDKNTAYYTFGQYRYFGPKLDVDYVSDNIEDNQTSGKRFYNTIAKHQYNFFKNTHLLPHPCRPCPPAAKPLYFRLLQWEKLAR